MDQMTTNHIQPGTILMADGTLLPSSVQCEGEPFTPGWSRIKNLDSNGIDRALGRAGWSFFYLAGGIRARVFGGDAGPATVKGVKRIIAGLKTNRFNCLEITQVAVKSILGFRYVIVDAYSRHIQASLFLSTEHEPVKDTVSKNGSSDSAATVK
jgi:hypothetical protein